MTDWKAIGEAFNKAAREMDRRQAWVSPVLVFFGGRIVASTHDETVVEIPEKNQADATRAIQYVLEGVDPYRAIAAAITNTLPDAVTRAQRAAIKAQLFGYLYARPPQ